jgi:hypothetical protein
MEASDNPSDIGDAYRSAIMQMSLVNSPSS